MKKNAKKGITPASIQEPEKVIVTLARKGFLARIGEKAIESSHRKGLSITILENGSIYRVSPDGSKKLIKRIHLHTHTYATGKLFIK